MPNRGRAAGGGGFTLLELLIVMIAIAVVASFAIPAWFGRPEVTLDNATRLLAQDLRDAQNRATYGGEELRVVFREDGDGYSVVDARGLPVAAPIGNGPFERVYSSNAIFEGVTIPKVDVGDERTIRYDADGRAWFGGSVYLRFKGDGRVVSVQRESGLIEIQGLVEAWFDSGH